MTRIHQIIPFLLLVLMTQALTTLAQQTEGIVHYTRKTYWSKVYSRMTYLSQEQKDRIANTNRNYNEYKEKMKLVFGPSASVYGYESDVSESDDGRWSWRNKALSFYRDYDKERIFDVEEMLGKTYAVDDSLRLPKWKIGNQVREIAGHMCLNASTIDPTKNQQITAWFAQDIPVPAGPERYVGLPGLILELDINDGDVIIEAVSIEAKPVADLLKPLKPKKPKQLDEKGYQALISGYIADQMKAQQNPYWELRY